MVKYQIIGEIWKDITAIKLNIKPYKSKIFNSDKEALKYAYSMIYKKDGNTKRSKNVLVNFYIHEIK